MGNPLDIALEVAEAVIPPEDNNPVATRKWRMTVVLVFGATTMFNVFHVLWACGWLSYFGLTGFAQAQDFQKFQGQVDNTRVNLETTLNQTRLLIVENNLKEAMKTRCLALLQNNQQALDLANNEIYALANQYFSLKGRPYREQSCSVVLIAKVP